MSDFILFGSPVESKLILSMYSISAQTKLILRLSKKFCILILSYNSVTEEQTKEPIRNIGRHVSMRN